MRRPLVCIWVWVLLVLAAPVPRRPVPAPPAARVTALERLLPSTFSSGFATPPSTRWRGLQPTGAPPCRRLRGDARHCQRLCARTTPPRLETRRLGISGVRKESRCPNDWSNSGVLWQDVRIWYSCENVLGEIVRTAPCEALRNNFAPTKRPFKKSI